MWQKVISVYVFQNTDCLKQQSIQILQNLSRLALMMDTNFTAIPDISTNQLTQITNGDFIIPSSESNLALNVPPTDLEAMCRDLLRSGDISSDG